MRTNLTCEACRTELSALADGALHPAVARVLLNHIDACPGCRDILLAYRAIAAHARRLPSIEAPSWLEGRVVHAVVWPERARRFGTRALATATAASFAITVGLLVLYSRLAGELGIPTPGGALAGGVVAALDLLIAIPKSLAAELALYGPLARQVWLVFEALAAVPRALLLVLRTPGAQWAAAILLTMGVAIYWILRPSRSHERGIGHACLAL